MDIMKTTKAITIALAILATSFTHLAIATNVVISGRAISVSDGDTLTILDEQQVQHKIRLSGIDAPESGQDFWKKSKQSLAMYVWGFLRIEAHCEARSDRYGRKICTVYVPVTKTNVNIEQVKSGMAMVYRKYSNDPHLLVAENSARSAKIGIWSKPNPMPPWEWRRAKRSSNY